MFGEYRNGLKTQPCGPPVLSEWSSEGPTLLNVAGFLKNPVSIGRCYNRDPGGTCCGTVFWR